MAKKTDYLVNIRPLLDTEDKMQADYLKCLEMYMNALAKKHIAFSANPFLGYSKNFLKEGNVKEAMKLLYGIAKNFATNKDGVSAKFNKRSGQAKEKLTALDDGSFSRIVNILKPYLEDADKVAEEAVNGAEDVR